MLVEVLLSLVILTAGLIVVSRSFISSLSATRLLKNHYQATVLLERKLAEVESGAITVSGGEETILEGEEDGFHWTIQGDEPLQEDQPAAPFTEVKVKVCWVEKEKEREVTASMGLASSY